MAAPWQLDHEAAAAQRDGDVLAESAGGQRGRCGGGLPGAADGASGPAGRGALGGRGRVTSRSTTGAQPARRRTLARESVTYKSSFDFSFDRPRAVRALVLGARPRREGEGGSLFKSLAPSLSAMQHACSTASGTACATAYSCIQASCYLGKYVSILADRSSHRRYTYSRPRGTVAQLSHLARLAWDVCLSA